MYPYPYARPSLFRGLSLTKNINWGGLLDGTQKTLGVINQAIPIVYQVKPIINNAKTMFRIAGELKNPSSNNINTSQSTPINTNNNSPQNRPIFYI